MATRTRRRRFLAAASISLAMLIGQVGLASTGAVAAPPGPNSPGQITHRTVYSSILGFDEAMNVYTPPQYDGKKPLPVLYAFPGGCGDEGYYPFAGVTVQLLDDLFLTGKATPMIVVMLSGNWNGADAFGNPFEAKLPKVLVEEVVPFIDDEYKTLPNARKRAVGGNSCGGAQTLNTMLQYPGEFSEIGLWSTGYLPDTLASLSNDPTAQAVLSSPKLRNRTEYLEVRIGADDTVAGANSEATVAFLQSFGIKADVYRKIPGTGHSLDAGRIGLLEGVASFFKKGTNR